jgi:hypothetical protein
MDSWLEISVYIAKVWDEFFSQRKMYFGQFPARPFDAVGASFN